MCGTKQEEKKKRERETRLIVGQSPVFVSFECYTCSCFSIFFFFYLLKDKQKHIDKTHFIILYICTK